MSNFHANRSRLGIEQLQDRIVPAVIVSQVDLDFDGAADDLMIVGDGGLNNVSIKDNGTNTLTVSVDSNGNGLFTDPGDLKNVQFAYGGDLAIVADLGLGADTFSYELTGALAGRTRDLNINLGIGADTATITTGALNATASRGSVLNVDVDGSFGVDTVNLTVGQVFGSAVAFHEDLGGGNDTSNVMFGAIDNGASVDVDADLGYGNNTFLVDFQKIGFSQNADVDIAIIGGIDVDNVTANLHDDVGSGTTRSTLVIDANLGQGNDVFRTNLDYGGNVFRVDDNSLASIRASGDVGDDILVVKGIGATGTIRIDPSALLDIQLNGGVGNDTINVLLGKTDALELIGGVKVRIDGGAGNDTVNLRLANNASSTGNYDVIVNAGAGNDTVVFALDNNGGNPSLKPNLVINGGLGIDTLIDSAKPLTADSFFETII